MVNVGRTPSFSGSRSSSRKLRRRWMLIGCQHPLVLTLLRLGSLYVSQVNVLNSADMQNADLDVIGVVNS